MGRCMYNTELWKYTQMGPANVCSVDLRDNAAPNNWLHIKGAHKSSVLVLVNKVSR